jgi:uncharacterized protein (DUF983 family)
MSHHGASDRQAAFTGLIVGAIALLIVVFTISKLTARKYAHEGAEKPTASAVR